MPAAAALSGNVKRARARREVARARQQARHDAEQNEPGLVAGAARELTTQQIQEVQIAFDTFDEDGSGKLEFNEMKKALHLTGVASTDEEIDAMLTAIDLNQDVRVPSLAARRRGVTRMPGGRMACTRFPLRAHPAGQSHEARSPRPAPAPAPRACACASRYARALAARRA